MSVDHEDEDEDDDEDIIIDISTFKFEEKELVKSEEPRNRPHSLLFTGSAKAPKRKFLVMAVSKLRSALALGRARIQFSSGLGRNVVGTVFTCRRGHVHFAFQNHFNATPAFLVELPMPRSILLKEMSSGLVSIALECDKNKGIGLLAEPVWRTYCNGKKDGYAMRRECGPEEWKVLNAIGPIFNGDRDAADRVRAWGGIRWKADLHEGKV
ncbi:protein MIZU-KUSSEI 1 [Sesamum angolense]|uniref:Protein MIZU-KUSSEI 1 n=1 Tax=Sesamum angolense TaxID=2727404 RepID=A0AAE1XED1_9LAMI|nr:protein MIZU-KUSSEI 1 [Sesamum angolense]